MDRGTESKLYSNNKEYIEQLKYLVLKLDGL